MRKVVISIAIILLLALVGVLIFQSISLGAFQILGVTGLGEKNEKLDTSIQNLAKLSSTDYEKALTDLTNSAKQYKDAKTKYDDLVTVSVTNTATGTNQIQKYEIEYLWTRIGTHATNEGVVLKLEIKATSTSAVTGYYDLKFTATGDYVGITDFVYDIENDSSLGFKIENFKLEPGGNNLTATFTCTNIAINIDPSNIAVQQATDNNTTNNNTNTTNTNTTGNTTSNNTTNSNTTNNTNSTNTSTGANNTASSNSNR